MDQGNRRGRKNLLAGERSGAGRPRSPVRARAAGADDAGRDSVGTRLISLRRQARDLAVHIESLTTAYEQAADETVTGHLEYLIRLKSQRLDELSSEAAALEQTLSASPAPQPAPEPEYAGRRRSGAAVRDRSRAARYLAGQDADRAVDAGSDGDAPTSYVLLHWEGNDGEGAAGSAEPPADGPGGRTEELISHGRRTSYPRLLRRHKKVSISAAVAAVLVTILVVILASGGASWPASVATVQSEADKACQNPNLESEPNQVNFACAKGTRQILWVFALLTSDDNPGFADAKTHRLGLEPIQAAEGGGIAWSLNLHHPYNPDNPIDSLSVAARAINNIVGGATLTGSNGSPVVQPGLEGDPGNCRRYTGSAALSTHNGFPSLCARPVTSPAGQAALVSDVYKRWIVGASAQAAQDAAVLYANSTNPGDPRVQAILKQLQSADLRA